MMLADCPQEIKFNRNRSAPPVCVCVSVSVYERVWACVCMAMCVHDPKKKFVVLGGMAGWGGVPKTQQSYRSTAPNLEVGSHFGPPGL